VSLVITNYNGKKNTLEFLKSLKKTDYPNYEIIVVDNASTDGSVQMVREHFPYVRIVESRKNVGVSEANNIGIKNAKGDYIVLLDNDVLVIRPDWLRELVGAIQSDDIIGQVSPVLMQYYNHEKIERNAPHGNDIEDIEYAGVSIVRRDVIDAVGEFDKKMFFCFQDKDYSYRIRKAGYRVVLTPKSMMAHKGSATIRDMGYLLIFHNYKNKIRFALKNLGFWGKLWVVCQCAVQYPLLFVRLYFNGGYPLAKAIPDAVLWNIREWKDYVGIKGYL
jgi:hypothetical protein